MQYKSRLQQTLSAAFFYIFLLGDASAGTNRVISALREGDCVKALKELIPVAEHGDIKAQNTLGEIYTDGDRYCPDFQPDLTQATHWYLRAAERGDPDAQHIIAGIYWDGAGVPADKARALEWLQKSAAQGNSSDLARLSDISEKGEGVPVDRVLAYAYKAMAAKIEKSSDVHYFDGALKRLAANMLPVQLKEAKQIAARWRLGMVIPKTSKTGHLLPSIWYHKTADAGNAHALYKLGIIYRDNLEGSQDNKKARLYLHAAAEKGHADAQEALAHMYKCGQCGPVDFVLSYVLSSLSVRGKGALAKAKINEMWEEFLTPEQIAEAKSLISRWSVGTPIPLKTQTGHLRKVNYAESGEAKQDNTPEVMQLFAAASEGDEKSFNRLIDAVPNINDYVVDGNMLLHALLLPAKSLTASEQKRQESIADRAIDAQLQERRAIHLAMLPAKTRMLELALQRGASVQEGEKEFQASPLHLATVFGTPEIVRLLLKYGADPNQYGGENYKHQPLEFSLAFSELRINLPELIDQEQRAQIIMALLGAGAKMPYMAVDKQLQRNKETKVERPAADYLLWDDLVSLTRGAEVLALIEKTGTTPFFDADHKSVIAYAAHAGNVDAVKWLKSRLPKGDDNETTEGILVDAAMWAMYSNANTTSALLNELVVGNMAWDRIGPMPEDSPKRYKLLNLPPSPATSTTLLGHAVLTRQYEWVTRLVKLGAPVDGMTGTNVTPLGHAVEAGDTEMVKLLLSLGADPVAGDFHSPLMRVVETDIKSPKAIEIMKLLLNKIIQEKKSISDTLAQDLVERAWAQKDSDDTAFAVINTLVDFGFSPARLGLHNISYAMQSSNRRLIDYLIAHGALQPRDGEKLPDTYSILLKVALHAHRDDLLPYLLAAGLDPNARIDDSETTPLEYAIYEGHKSAVAMFMQKSGRPDVLSQNAWGSAVDLAIASGDEDILRMVTNNFSVRLDNACLPNTRMLVETVLNRSDAYWSLLLEHGFGSAADSCGTMVDRLAQALSDAPDVPQVGWLGQQLAQRLKAISSNGARLNSLVSVETYELLNKAGRQDIVRSLQAAGWEAKPISMPAKTIPPVKSSTKKDISLSKKLVGHYYLENLSEVGSELILLEDGHFYYALSYGAVDQVAEGTWTVANGSVIFRSDVIPSKEQYRLVEAQPSQDSKVLVSISYKERAVPGISVTLLGEHGIKVSGVTTDSGLSASLPGPVKQVILYHDELNNGHAFVYEASGTHIARNFAFEIEPMKRSNSEFNVDMSVRNGQLVWRRDGRELRFKKQN